jgi:acyl-CoA reductase-like NAD-dependent aldehyde dehydrogenase
MDDLIRRLKEYAELAGKDQMCVMDTDDLRAAVRAAVEDHSWMFLTGPGDAPEKQIIEHEGE